MPRSARGVTKIPRNVDGTYSKAEPSVQANTTIASSVFNNVIDDLVTDANAARPVASGGTGAGTTALARQNLDVAQQQESTADGTAGRGLIVGAFGLGGNAIVKVDFDELVTTSAFIRTGAVSTPHAPDTSNIWSGTNIRRSSDDGWQLMAEGNDVNLEVRFEEVGVWSDWMPIPILISTTTSANGIAWRYSDGKQVCVITATASIAISTAHMGGFRSAAQTWTFPAAFNAAPRVWPAVSATSAFGAVMGAPSTTEVAWSVTAISSQSADVRTVFLRAEGTWR